MKKIFLSAAVIASSFVAFAFKPIEKNNSIDNALTALSFIYAGSCDKFYETKDGLSKCHNVFTEIPVEGKEEGILNEL